jgi:hypothetical protein
MCCFVVEDETRRFVRAGCVCHGGELYAGPAR